MCRLNLSIIGISLTDKSIRKNTCPIAPQRVEHQYHTLRFVRLTSAPLVECCGKGRPIYICVCAKVSVVPSVDPQGRSVTLFLNECKYFVKHVENNDTKIAEQLLFVTVIYNSICVK